MTVQVSVKKSNMKSFLKSLNLKGKYKIVHRDVNHNILSVEEVENLITNEGKDYVLDTSLHNSTSVATWYFAIFTDGTPGATQTYAAKGRTESTNYDEASRQAWGEGASSSQSVTNSTAATITASTGGIAATGIGVVGSPSGAAGLATKNDSAAADGILLSSGTISKTLAVGETLDITYTLSA